MGSLQEPVGSSLRSSNSAGVKSDPRAQAHGGDAYSGAPQELPAVEVHRFRRGLTVGDSPLRWKDDVSHGSSSDTQLGLAGSNVRGKVIEGTPGQCTPATPRMFRFGLHAGQEVVGLRGSFLR